MRKTLLAAALSAIVLTQYDAHAQSFCGDVNDSGTVTSADALLVLKTAVGQPTSLTCDQCGSSCAGDPRYLLGEWLFESDIGGTLYETTYDLFAVDEVNCEIVGQDPDDLSIVYAYAGVEFDYVLLDPDETYCDLYVFDYVGPDQVEGQNLLLDLDVDGACDFDSVFDEGTTIGDRISTAIVASPIHSGSKLASKNVSSLVDMSLASHSIVDGDPERAALLDRLRSQYERHRKRSTR